MCTARKYLYIPDPGNAMQAKLEIPEKGELRPKHFPISIGEGDNAMIF